MLTIHFHSFWSFQDAEIETCIKFVEGFAVKPDKTNILKDDEDDPESSCDIFFHYFKYNLEDFIFYDELMDFANNYEIYVLVYDHNTKDRKGYWYDESNDWIIQNTGEIELYTKEIKK